MVGAGANGEPVDPGTTITFLINGSNAGPADAVDPVVTGQLPAGLSYVNLPAAIGWNCSFDDATNQSFSCLRTSDLAPGGALLLSYTAIVDADAPRGASLDSTVTASSSTTDPTPATATNTIVITQPGASISLIHSVSYSGDQCITNAKPLDSLVADAESVPVTWCLKVTNTGMVALTDVTLNAPGIGVVDLDVLSAAGQTVLAPAESINVSFPGAIPNEGLISIAGVAGVPSDAAGNPIPGLEVQVDDDNATVLEASINIETTVVAGPNGDCADAGELETVALGSGVTWCYAVTNTGFTTLSVAEVTDTALGLTIPIAPAQQRLSIGTTVVVSADTIAAAAITADGAVEGQPLGFNDEALAVPPVADRDDARLEILPSTPTPTATSVPVATATSTPVPVATSTSTPVPVATATSTPIPVATSTSTPVPVSTATSTPVPVATPTSTPVPVATPTSTPVPVATSTSTPVPVSTATSTPVPVSTATATPVPVSTSTSTPVPASTATSTPVPAATSTSTPVPVSTATSTPVPVSTATSTPVPVSTATSTPVPVSTATSTPIPVSTATSTPVPVATATSTPEPGATATATATPEPAATTTPTPEPDPLSLDLTDPFVCGVGFLGSINGGTAPYQLAYTLQPVDGGATIDLGSFGVPSAGAFVNPGSFIAPLAGIDGDFLVSVSLSDGAAQLLAKPNLFTAQVRTVCNSGTSAPTEALPYPGPFSSSPVTGASSGSVPAPSSSGAATTSSSDAPAPASATNSAPPLATTGTNTPLLASLSMLFLTLGGVLLVASRREERDAR